MKQGRKATDLIKDSRVAIQNGQLGFFIGFVTKSQTIFLDVFKVNLKNLLIVEAKYGIGEPSEGVLIHLNMVLTLT